MVCTTRAKAKQQQRAQAVKAAKPAKAIKAVKAVKAVKAAKAAKAVKAVKAMHTPQRQTKPNVKLVIKPTTSDVRRAYKRLLDAMSLHTLASPNLILAMRNHLQSHFQLTVGALAPYQKRFERWMMKHLMTPCVQQTMLAAIASPDTLDQLAATKLFRLLLSAKHNENDNASTTTDRSPNKGVLSNEALTDHVVSVGIIPRVVDFMSSGHCEELQYEAAWLLSNIAFGTLEHAHAVTQAGAVPVFVSLLHEDNNSSEAVKEQALWGLANIAAEVECRNLVLSSGVTGTVEHLLKRPSSSPDMIQNAAWLMHNLVRGTEGGPTDASVLWHIATVLGRILMATDDEETLTDVACAMKQLADINGETNLATMLYHPSGTTAGIEVAARMLELAKHGNPNISGPLRAAMMCTMRHVSENETLLNGILDHAPQAACGSCDEDL
jgi:hypothetical protein